MNKIKYIIVFAVCLICTSCEDYLDRTPDDKVTEEQVFTRFDKVDRLVADLYRKSRESNQPLIFFGHFGTAAITDECDASNHEGAITQQFNIGNWGPTQDLPGSAGQYWWDLYDRVRRANVIIEGIRKYDTPDDPRPGKEGSINKRLGEAFFLRGYIYYLLVREYGEVPYIDHTDLPEEGATYEKLSVHNLVAKICSDADTAFNLVAVYNGDVDFGRVDKGACLGLKAMARWLAATPMWNGGDFPNDTRVFKQEYTYDPARWEAAKVAAKAVIDCKHTNGAPRYSLYKGYDDTDFTDSKKENSSNGKVYRRLWEVNYDMNAIMSEWVWFVTRAKDSGWSGDIFPPSMDGHARQRPSQEQVDEYEVIINGYGYPIYSEEAKAVYDDENPYVNRDPRFYRDISYHGAVFNNNLINTAEGKDKVSDNDQSPASHTGYYLRKFLKEGWNRGDAGHTINGPAIFRLPTFIYIYAEAVNNTTGPSKEIYDMINEVRERSFMAPMPPKVATNKELMNEYIQRERRVELFYENDRVWRCRLYLEPDTPAELAKEAAWKAAGSNQANLYPYPKCQRALHGMRPVEDENGKIEVGGKKYKMERFKVEDRVFNTPRHYLFPIMDDELKRSPGLVQNPGW